MSAYGRCARPAHSRASMLLAAGRAQSRSNNKLCPSQLKTRSVGEAPLAGLSTRKRSGSCEKRAYSAGEMHGIPAASQSEPGVGLGSLSSGFSDRLAQPESKDKTCAQGPKLVELPMHL